MSLAFRTGRVFWLKRNVKWSAARHGTAQHGPAPARDLRQLADHGFCQRENKQNKIISLYRTMSAKTRANAKLRHHAHTAAR